MKVLGSFFYAFIQLPRVLVILVTKVDLERDPSDIKKVACALESLL